MMHWTQIVAFGALVFGLFYMAAEGGIRDALQFLLRLAIIALLGTAAVGAFAP